MTRMTREKAVTTQRRLYEMAASKKVLVSGHHFCSPFMGYVDKDDANYRLEPVRCSPSL